MRRMLLPLLLFSTPAAAQIVAPPAPPAPIPAVWNPAAPYITAGQDEPGYRSWYLAAPWRAAQVKSFNDYLASYQVSGIVPTWQLLRTATSWSDCGGQPFEVPPTTEWPHIVQTLRYIHDYVIPAVGPVEPVSGYRNPVLNQCAGGAPESAHKHYSAIDLVPLRATTREAMMRTLCVGHSEHGAQYNTGLGFYAYLRFHVDSTKFRRWNMDPAVAAQCPPIVHTEDIASVGQPLPQTPLPQSQQPLATAVPTVTGVTAEPGTAETTPLSTTVAAPAPVPPSSAQAQPQQR
jgi:hypothetical protein